MLEVAHVIVPALGAAFTVAILVATPAAAVYDIVAVPGATAYTVPVLFTVATDMLLLLQVPPAVALVKLE
jgi:hypothetical protein